MMATSMLATILVCEKHVAAVEHSAPYSEHHLSHRRRIGLLMTILHIPITCHDIVYSLHNIGLCLA